MNRHLSPRPRSLRALIIALCVTSLLVSSANARALQADLTAMLQIARHHYPNLRVVYLSSRNYGGWSGRDSGSPESYAYESGFGTR